MPEDYAKIETDAMKLSLNERAKLAERLLLSLDLPNEEENQSLWLEEAERRLASWRAGEAKGVPVAKVFENARKVIQWRKR